MSRLLRVELRRLWARRVVRVLMLLFLVLIAVVIVANYFNATDERPLTYAFVADSGRGFGGGFAALVFIVGASAGGAEWAARTVEALLVWEPRRVRLMLAKVSVLAASVAVTATVVQVVAGLLSRAAVAGRGSMNGAAADFWSTYVSFAATNVVYAVMTALLGFAIASLTRNTGFALGAALVYFGFVDRLLTLLPDWVDRLTFIVNAAAFLDHGSEFDDISLSTLHGGVTVAGYVSVLVVAAVTLFRRRDVT
jgi:ABC-2 type transport system permease protein